MWPFRHKHSESDDAPELRRAEYEVIHLQHRATKVEHHLRKRFERNHWSETVDQLWRGSKAE